MGLSSSRRSRSVRKLDRSRRSSVLKMPSGQSSTHPEANPTDSPDDRCASRRPRNPRRDDSRFLPRSIEPGRGRAGPPPATRDRCAPESQAAAVAPSTVHSGDAPSRSWSHWKTALAIVQAKTVVRWHPRTGGISGIVRPERRASPIRRPNKNRRPLLAVLDGAGQEHVDWDSPGSRAKTPRNHARF